MVAVMMARVTAKTSKTERRSKGSQLLPWWGMTTRNMNYHKLLAQVNRVCVFGLSKNLVLFYTPSRVFTAERFLEESFKT